MVSTGEYIMGEEEERGEFEQCGRKVDFLFDR